MKAEPEIFVSAESKSALPLLVKDCHTTYYVHYAEVRFLAFDSS